jgi:hypothetical protein
MLIFTPIKGQKKHYADTIVYTFQVLVPVLVKISVAFFPAGIAEVPTIVSPAPAVMVSV